MYEVAFFLTLLSALIWIALVTAEILDDDI